MRGIEHFISKIMIRRSNSLSLPNSILIKNDQNNLRGASEKHYSAIDFKGKCAQVIMIN